MNPSPLQLERHFFTRIQLEANPGGKPELGNLLHSQVEVGRAPEDQKRFQVVLRLKLQSPADGQACYTGQIDAVGLFRVVDSWPEDRILDLVQANGAALVFGAIREMVCNLTARGPWPQVTLQTVTFVQPKVKALASPARGVKPATVEK
jgi:preprotein translocase subunit SecB